MIFWGARLIARVRYGQDFNRVTMSTQGLPLHDRDDRVPE